MLSRSTRRCVAWHCYWGVERGTQVRLVRLLLLFCVGQVAFVTATNNYRKELQFRALRHDADDMVRVRVLRNGSDVPVAVADVVVGDVLHLETGDKVRIPWFACCGPLCVVVLRVAIVQACISWFFVTPWLLCCCG